jgi:hypothetical protein
MRGEYGTDLLECRLAREPVHGRSELGTWYHGRRRGVGSTLDPGGDELAVSCVGSVGVGVDPGPGRLIGLVLQPHTAAAGVVGRRERGGLKVGKGGWETKLGANPDVVIRPRAPSGGRRGVGGKSGSLQRGSLPFSISCGILLRVSGIWKAGVKLGSWRNSLELAGRVY